MIFLLVCRSAPNQSTFRGDKDLSGLCRGRWRSTCSPGLNAGRQKGRQRGREWEWIIQQTLIEQLLSADSMPWGWGHSSPTLKEFSQIGKTEKCNNSDNNCNINSWSHLLSTYHVSLALYIVSAYVNTQNFINCISFANEETHIWEVICPRLHA